MKVHCAYDKMVPVSELKPHPKNRNEHSGDQVVRLAKILDYQGWRYPIKVSNRSGYITSGHGRLLSALHMGWTEVPVNFQDYDDETMEYLDVQADNAIASWAELDLSGINIDIGELGPFDIDLLGIKDFTVDINEKEEEEDAVPATPKVARTKFGELWNLGNHRLLCGDSTQSDQVARLMNGEKAALWLSDPPYGINHVETSQEKGQSKGYEKIANDDLEDKEFEEFIFKCITASLPSMKKGFAFYMWHAMKMQGYTAAAAAAAAAAGILFHRQIIWVKPQFIFGRGHYHWRHELCLMGWLQGNEPPFYGERNQSTVWEVARENDKIHPTQKPVELLLPSILNHTTLGEITYEPFCGSGSTLIACEKTSRKCYAMELSPAYCDVIIERWQNYTGQSAVREDGVKWSDIDAQG